MVLEAGAVVASGETAVLTAEERPARLLAILGQRAARAAWAAASARLRTPSLLRMRLT